MTFLPLRRLRSGSRMRPALARRMASCGNGPSVEHGQASPPTSAMPTPISLVPFARHAAPVQHSPCRMLTRKPCNCTSKKYRAALLLDRAGWHITNHLMVPANITLIFLPSRAPELNPQENIWPCLRANWHSNRVFETYDAIVEASCEAWRKLAALPATITSIGMGEWAHVGQTL